MKALILAAGEGTRLRPLTSNIPKPLLLVAGRPFLSHVLEGLSNQGVKDITLLVGWKSDKIKEYYQDGSKLGLNISYLEQKERLGTANAIGCAEGIMDEPFICVNGDVVLFEHDIERMLATYARTKGTVMGAVNVSDPERFGVIEKEGEKLVRIIEKPKAPPTNLINAGLFVYTPEIFERIHATARSSRGEYEITDTLNALARDEVVTVQQLSEGWIDVGRPWDLLRANEILMSTLKRRIDGTVEQGATIKGEVVVEKGALVRAGSYIEGPVYISEGCDIGPNCYIRPSTCLGPRVRVGGSVEVKNTIVMAGSHIPHHNYVGDSLIGERCNLGAGTKVANLRFDDSPVKVTFKGHLIDSGRRKLGVIMGDDVKTGINAMIDAGTIIYENAVIGPGSVVRGSIGPGSWVL
jgi:UDP-N-acetylglucosamine diphosphorylase / glucose-1-phosphate thymidylyltransferase / UDP-N-acetylgalactosamine diphosphorylase / glucosamine-1-phosphate N-acetyltransferase / galactosamine-1-phosphate N-acetyltransferase